MRKRFAVGDRVTMNEDALANYGEEYRDKSFVVTHVSTKHMPASEFFAKGKPEGFHPGFDVASGCALYDFEELPMALYDWEVSRA